MRRLSTAIPKRCPGAGALAKMVVSPIAGPTALSVASAVPAPEPIAINARSRLQPTSFSRPPGLAFRLICVSIACPPEVVDADSVVTPYLSDDRGRRESTGIGHLSNWRLDGLRRISEGHQRGREQHRVDGGHQGGPRRARPIGRAD